MQALPNTETYDTFARPGDPGFTSFPRQLSEDTVSYSIYVVSNELKSDAQIRARLTEILKSANSLARSLLKDYIWQRESFAPALSSPKTSTSSKSKWQSSCLHGQTEFGDSIADEWVIVYILRELSKQFKDAWIRVEDADGEFLLVEAANAIPKWLNPENASHRVWIHDGGLRIIPRESLQKSQGSSPTHTSKMIKPRTSPLSLSDALDFIERNQDKLIDSPTIQSEAFYRLRDFPSQISESMHTAKIVIPRKLAYILHSAPAHISPAVEAFYLRDPISLRPLEPSETSQLNFQPHDRVETSVRFTRVGYAQLKTQHFPAPDIWADVINEGSNTTEKERLEMGMKVSSGFEMLVADPQNQDKRVVREIKLLLADVENGEESLPTDAEIASWPQVNDDDGWLDVDFEDLENELSGKGQESSKHRFGRKSAQQNLHEFVERFQQFLGEDGADLHGSDSEDDMDFDDDGSEEVDSARGQSVSDDELVASMEAMMKSTDPVRAGSSSGQQVGQTIADDDSDDEEAIRNLSNDFEAELRAADALHIDGGQNSQLPDESDLQEYMLLKNMLEAFKEEGGASGPAGNLLRSFGLNLPRENVGKR